MEVTPELKCGSRARMEARNGIFFARSSSYSVRTQTAGHSRAVCLYYVATLRTYEIISVWTNVL